LAAYYALQSLLLESDMRRVPGKIIFPGVLLSLALVVCLNARTSRESSGRPPLRQSFSAQEPQPNQPQNDAQARIRVSSNLVVLPVAVLDDSGNLVPDLRREDFRVFEDNIEQSIDVFSTEAFPLSIVALIDNDLKNKDADAVRKSLAAIAGGMSVSDEAFVCRFDQFFHPGKGFTSDQDKLLTELKRTKVGGELDVAPPGGPFSGPAVNNHAVGSDAPIDRQSQLIKGQPTKALDDAVYASAQLLHDRPRDRRKLIVLISDGVNGGKKVNTLSYDDVIKTLQQYNIAVYSIAVPSAYLERKLPLDPKPSPLIRYAKDSGGEIYHATKPQSFEEFYSRLMEEARNQYTLAYVPRGTDRSSEYHSVEVRVKREGLTIKTRERYYTGAIPSK
jgi:VWFA-related protein